MTRVQLEFIKQLYDYRQNSSITFIVDTAQSIYPHSWLVKGRSFTTIGFDMTGKSNSLTKNYRTTTQIAQAAYSLIENDENIIDDENYVPPSLMDRQGYYPVLKSFRTPREEAIYVAEEIKSLLEHSYAYGGIVVIARMRKQFKLIQEVFHEKNIPVTVITKQETDFEGDTVRLLTMHAIKGLEFQIVFTIGLKHKVIPYVSYTDQEDQGIQKSNERKLLYVGMTRAKELLYLSYSGTPSVFVKDISPGYLRLNTHSRAKVFYPVHLEDYLYTDKILDIYSSEEETRQWILQELISTYGYPLALIEVEYKVKNFSQVGFVDIAVMINHKGSKVPYIIIETKSPGKGIKEGMDQLKSYMNNCNTCRYGVITDGSEFVVLNRNLEQVEDIPQYHPSMQSSGGRVYEYRDLVKQFNCRLIKNPDSPGHIVVESKDNRLEYLEPDTRKFPWFHHVSAGDLSLMNEKAEGSFILPAEWYESKGTIFLLRVRGDSMIDADIYENDLVVVEQRQDAQNRDIVVVAINEEATLKRYVLMGDSVLLIPENDKYEPIQINTEQARVMGVVIGMIKRVGE